jgi:hypothetical protein
MGHIELLFHLLHKIKLFPWLESLEATENQGGCYPFYMELLTPSMEDIKT